MASPKRPTAAAIKMPMAVRCSHTSSIWRMLSGMLVANTQGISAEKKITLLTEITAVT